MMELVSSCINCITFCTEMIQQIKKRYAFDDEFFHIVPLGQPRHARCRNPPTQLFKRLPEIKSLQLSLV